MQYNNRAFQNFLVENMHSNCYGISLYHLIDPLVHNIQFVLLINYHGFYIVVLKDTYRSHYAYPIKDVYVTVFNNMSNLGSS